MLTPAPETPTFGLCREFNSDQELLIFTSLLVFQSQFIFWMAYGHSLPDEITSAAFWVKR